MVQRLLPTIQNKKNFLLLSSLSYLLSFCFQKMNFFFFEKLWNTFFSFLLSQNIFCACSLFLKTLLRICNCLLVHVFFFPNLSLIIVCSVVGVTRTSAAGHPLHQAVSCHLLSFHFIVSVFSLLYIFMIMCLFILLKKSCFAVFFNSYRIFSLLFFFEKNLLVYSLLVRSPLVVLPFCELFHISTSVFHLFFERLFSKLATPFVN